MSERQTQTPAEAATRTLRLHSLVVLSGLLAWCTLLVGFRMAYTGHGAFVFMIWNLFLASVPLIVSRVLLAAHNRRTSDVAQLGLAALWLLFLPNAPYVFTDLIHLERNSPLQFSYDLAMLMSCAGTGLLLGYWSLFDVHKILEERFGRRLGWAVAIGSLLLAGYGVYLGRVMRWNSWDVLTNPFELFSTMVRLLLNPTEHIRMYMLTAAASICLVLGYAVLRSVRWIRSLHAND